MLIYGLGSAKPVVFTLKCKLNEHMMLVHSNNLLFDVIPMTFDVINQKIKKNYCPVFLHFILKR